MSRNANRRRRELLTPEEKAVIAAALATGNKRAASTVREAVERFAMRNGPIEIFDPIEIFERDGWVCKQCNTPTPRELRGVNVDNSPTLDHVVPIILRGCHTRENCQLLCRGCNSAKDQKLAGPVRCYTNLGNKLREALAV